MIRIDNRSQTQLRPIRLTVDYLDYAEGSVLIEAGNTRVLCAASVEEKVPAFLEGKGKGWVTAEYSMLPRSTHTRNSRERDGRVSVRTQEIQRLIGRSLRAVLARNCRTSKLRTVEYLGRALVRRCFTFSDSTAATRKSQNSHGKKGCDAKRGAAAICTEMLDRPARECATQRIDPQHDCDLQCGGGITQRIGN